MSQPSSVISLAPTLPFNDDALEPHLSREAIRAHFGGFHRRQADRLRDLVQGTEYEKATLDELMHPPTPRTIRDTAMQVWNHAFLWESLAPSSAPSDTVSLPVEIGRLLTQRFGGLDDFKREFRRRVYRIQGSGWIWLVLDSNGSATILLLRDEANPRAFGYEPLLGCDLWEHAYYLDHRDDRDAYVAAWWNIVDWRFVDDRLKEHRTRRRDPPTDQTSTVSSFAV
jgi:Fe-Mn family superoxide dismutase